MIDKTRIYGGFASVYDMFMDNIPYDDWSDYLVERLRENGVMDGLVVDLGCGTGNITQRLSSKGYDMIGIDNSEEMLSIAMEKSSGNILYLLQDMRNFELYGTVKAAVSICDSLNYIMAEDELEKVFRLVNNYLDEKGVFIFDLNTEYKYQRILADNTIAENRDDNSFIWDNYYDEKERINEYALTLYIRDSLDNRIYRRFDETHYQKAYSLETIKALLSNAGMEFVAAYDAFTRNPPLEESERVYIIAREGTQRNKVYFSGEIKSL